MKTKISNMFYEVFGEIDKDSRHVYPDFTVKIKAKEEEYKDFITHFRKFESNSHLSVFSFLNALIELENNPDYIYFLNLIFKFSTMIYNNPKIKQKSFLVLDFNYLLKIFIDKKSDKDFLSCKVSQCCLHNKCVGFCD